MNDSVFKQAGLSPEWAHEFVVESNQIDPQPGANAPGSPLYDLHYSALAHAVWAGVSDRYALPRDLHTMLLPGHPSSGVLRTQPCTIGFKELLQPQRVLYYTWRWNVDARENIDELRSRPCSSEECQTLLWDLHCELMNIRPFELYNGRVGRLLLVNHALLLGEKPPLIRFAGRATYLETINSNVSATWVTEPQYRPSAICYREW